MHADVETHYGSHQPPFRNAYGASQRHVVDMADVDGSRGFVIPTGQSGNPLSHHYRDQTPCGAKGAAGSSPWTAARPRRASYAASA
jgi:penicillin amidase